MLKFTGVIERKDTITIDGYSNRKTLKAAFNELAKEVAKYDEIEAMGITNMNKSDIEDIQQFENYADSYYVEVQEVGCASKWNNETDGMEYDEANFYLLIRFVKSESEENEPLPVPNNNNDSATKDMMRTEIINRMADFAVKNSSNYWSMTRAEGIQEYTEQFEENSYMNQFFSIRAYLGIMIEEGNKEAISIMKALIKYRLHKS